MMLIDSLVDTPLLDVNGDNRVQVFDALAVNYERSEV